MRGAASRRAIEQVILLLRGQKVMLDAHLAELYGAPVKVLNQAVKRNIARFPKDFMFQLGSHEVNSLRSQIVTLDAGRGRHRKYAPYVFSEQGVAMLSSVLRSERAVQVNIEIMRAFVHLRRILQSDAELARKLTLLERKYDSQFRLRVGEVRVFYDVTSEAVEILAVVSKEEATRWLSEYGTTGT